MKTNQIKSVIKLATGDKRPTHHRLPTEADVQELLNIIGEKALDHLLKINSAIYIFKNPEQPRKDEANSHPPYPHYTQEVGIVVDKHIIFLHLYTPKHSLFPKVLEVSFAFLSDYKNRANNMYSKIKRIKYLKDSDEIDTSNLKILVNLRQFITLVPSSVQIVIFYTSKQRGRVYRSALRRLPNIHLKPSNKLARF